MSKDVKEQLEAWAAEGVDGQRATSPTPQKRPPVTVTPERQDRPRTGGS